MNTKLNQDADNKAQPAQRSDSMTAEDYLTDRYGAYRGHFAWRELEEAFNAGLTARSVLSPLGAGVAAPVVPPAFNRKLFIRNVVTAVCEIPGRDSPDDQPEMMLVSDKELATILEEEFEEFDAAPTLPEAAVQEGDSLNEVRGKGAAEWYTAYCEASEKLKAANECIERYKARAAKQAQPVATRLCDQLADLKRRMRHTPGTGQNHSYYLAEDVDTLVEQARAALATHPQPAAAERAISAQKLDSLIEDLRGYAGDSGYSHNDYADTMRQAADALAYRRGPVIKGTNPVLLVQRASGIKSDEWTEVESFDAFAGHHFKRRTLYTEPATPSEGAQAEKCDKCGGEGWVRDVHDMEQGLIRCQSCTGSTPTAAADGAKQYIKPCLCGSDTGHVGAFSVGPTLAHAQTDWHSVVCGGCGYTTEAFGSEREAISAWNCRAVAPLASSASVRDDAEFRKLARRYRETDFGAADLLIQIIAHIDKAIAEARQQGHIEGFHNGVKHCDEQAAIAASLTATPAAAPQGVELTPLYHAAVMLADDVINAAFEGGSLDGGEVQDQAVKYGLLTERKMDEPCSPSCLCAENSVDFPTHCCQKNYIELRRAAVALAAKQEGK